MKITVHDCLVNILGYAPSEVLVSTAMLYSPENILALSEQWGANDTEVQEATYRWLKSVFLA